VLFRTSFAKLLGVTSLALLIFLPFQRSPIGSKVVQPAPLQIGSQPRAPVALQGLLNNIGLNSSQAPGASQGIVIASQSTTNPNCIWFLCLEFKNIRSNVYTVSVSLLCRCMLV